MQRLSAQLFTLHDLHWGTSFRCVAICAPNYPIHLLQHLYFEHNAEALQSGVQLTLPATSRVAESRVGAGAHSRDPISDAGSSYGVAQLLSGARHAASVPSW